MNIEELKSKNSELENEILELKKMEQKLKKNSFLKGVRTFILLAISLISTILFLFYSISNVTYIKIVENNESNRSKDINRTVRYNMFAVPVMETNTTKENNKTITIKKPTNKSHYMPFIYSFVTIIISVLLFVAFIVFFIYRRIQYEEEE